MNVSEKTGREAVAVLSAILQMSDAAEALGGAASIAGVASLHRMQTSIQKNGKRIGQLLAKDQA